MPRPKKRGHRGPRPYRHRVTRHYDPEGRRCKAGDPGAVRRVEPTAVYFADFWVSGKRTRISLGTDDLTVAWSRLRAEMQRRHERALGIRDRFSEAAECPLEEHLDDWIATVRAGGTSDKQQEALRHALDTLATLAGWERIADLDHDSCAAALAELLEPDADHPRGRSAQTRNHYLRHAKQFALWAAGPGKRLRENPFAGLEPISVDADRRHDRRTPSDAEVAALFEYLDGNREGAIPPVRRGVPAAVRALGYRVAMATGFRAGELRGLARACFDLDAGAVTLPAKKDKRRVQAVQELPAWLAAQLRQHFASGGTTFEVFPASNPGRMLRADLEAAGIPYTVKHPAGHDLYFDFHSLRHWFCSWLALLPGISPRTLLALTRHSTVELAMGVYGQARTADTSAAVQSMPEIAPQRIRKIS